MKALEFTDCTDEGEKIYIGFYLHSKHLEIFMGGDCHTESFVLSKGQISKLIKFLQKNDSGTESRTLAGNQSDTKQSAQD